uniref:Uncharacterized protein n=1 Tax=Alexandrium monilatum TaxID=311494 RepID=A0A7S4PUS7_9DINO
MGGRGGFIGIRGAEGGSGPRSRRLAARSRGAAEGRTAHHRRLSLVTPTAEEPWPRPDDGVAMVADTDGLGAAVFDFEETPASAKAVDQLRRCLASQDPQLLQHFLQHNPFCVDGLLTLAEYLRSQQSHEQAFQLVRRATYAVECAFNPGFSPFQERGVGPSARRPCVVLRLSDDPAWPGWSVLRTLWMHMQGLAGQGLHRTALEGCKLLLAATLPRDPCRALVSCDFLCLRSRQYDLLARLARDLVPQYGLQGEADSSVCCLDMALPNFAYSVALAGFLKAGGPPDFAVLNEVSIDEVAPPDASNAGDGSAIAEPAAAMAGAAVHAQLMRALLLFPLALRPLLEEAGAKLHGSAPGGSPSRQSWADLLAQPPFSNAADFRHAEHAGAHGRICGAYAKRCGSLWRADLVLRWLHGCTARLVSMHESSAFAARLSARRASWCEAPLCLGEALERDYPDLLPDDSVEAPKMPPLLEEAAQARLHPPRQWQEWEEGGEAAGPGGFPGMPAWAGAHAPPDRLAPTISLHSPPLLVFFQSLLPWGELDRSGVAVEPLSWLDVGRSAVGVAGSMALFAAGAATDVARFAAGLVRGIRAGPA